MDLLDGLVGRVPDDNELDIEGEINQEIKKMEGVDAKVVSYRKLD